ncbi:MAG: leucine--tRNA ligase [Holosporales bacterium]|jgi:leucyl-tRNA synthetase|nr:leucine--tRNA ligase [Holosporales bacterium]
MSDSIYNFRAVQKKWTDRFSKYSISNEELRKNKDRIFYVLEMLPYPSGKLHMGHARNYTIGDIVARHKKMLGFSVIHPMGWDAFGMPAENAAMKEGGHPKIWTNDNIQSMKEQLISFGYMYDWPREVSTCSEEYYSQEQKIFLDLYKLGLVYQKESYVNWDPVDKTVLANEQVIDGRGWRSGAVVEKRLLEQWSIKITDYAEKLLQGLKDLETHWPDKVLKMQENWIGKSQGALVNFDITTRNEKIPVFTTRPDTLFGASFLAISPDHDVAKELAKTRSDVAEFIDECGKTATTEELIEKMEKKGIFTGLFVKHPLKSEETLPIYIANFVLIDYGTGAVFGCPAHDERDFDFATKYNLKINRVVEGGELPYVDDGRHVNSEFLDGMMTAEAKACMIDYIEKNRLGERKITYRLRDWLVSRQRYWGCPIPIVHCPSCGNVPAELPVLLPDDVTFGGNGNPLENHPTWKHVKCPKCGMDAVRETDTLDTFFESSWYFLRYLDARCNDPINKEIADMTTPVDLYIGGVEHAVLHLLYARFFMLVLRDMGYVSEVMPFKSLLTQGMVCHKSYKNSGGEWVYPDDIVKTADGRMIDKDGREVFECSFEKMSKSKKNAISPEKIVESHGVDAVRLFIVSDTPPEKDLDWNTDALDGAWRFLNRVWKVFNKVLERIGHRTDGANTLIKTTHTYLKKITYSYENIALNKSVALIRELFNEIEDKINSESSGAVEFAFKSFVKAVYPVTPFICHEMWEILGGSSDIIDEKWPDIDEKLATADVVTIAIQINGKLKNTFEAEKDLDAELLKKMALDILGNAIQPNAIDKVIVVQNRVVNFVVNVTSI